MKRLYNEYHACPLFNNKEAEQIDEILSNAINKIWNEIIAPNNICPRDAQLLSIETVNGIFSEKILRKAMNKRKEEREINKKT